MWKNNIKIAWRHLLKNKTTGFINIFGLAIGMAVAIMIGLLLNDELTFNQHHQNYDRLAQLYIHQSFNEHQIGTSRAIAIPSAATLRNDFGDDFEAVSLASWNFSRILSYGEKKMIMSGMMVEPEFVKMFSLKLSGGGATEQVLNDPNSIIISQSLADALFDSENPIGKVIRYDAVSDLKVTGVFEDFPKNSSFFETSFFGTWEYFKSQYMWVGNRENDWGDHSHQVFAQIKPKATFAAISEKIKDIEKPHNPGTKPEYFLFPMSKWHLYPRFENAVNTGGRIQYVWLFGMIGVFVLLLACINFMNLSTAKSEKRSREVGIRKTVGSTRSLLIAQFLNESILVSLIALVFALFIVQFSLPWLNNLADKSMIIPFLNPIFWIIVLGFAFITGLLAGSYPAFYLSSLKALKSLKGTFKTGRWAALPRQALVTIQFTVSLALIIGTIVVFQQIQYAKNRTAGYDQEGVIQFRNNEELTGKEDVFHRELMQTGVVSSVAYSSSPITSIWSNHSGFDWEGKDPETIISMGAVACSPNFGKTVDWEIKEGRDFSQDFSLDTSSVILNESAVKLIGLDNIVGKNISYWDRPVQVIGIVKDIIMESPWRPIKPTIFSLDPERANMHTVRLNGKIPIKEAITEIKTVFEENSPSSPFNYQFVDEEYGEKFRTEESIGGLSRIFAILAIFISCLGLFGLSAFVAERRTKEIGIRKVLGATVANLWAMQSKNFIVLVIIAFILATPLTWYLLEGWLDTYDYRIELEWTVFAVGGLLVMAITILTVSYQSLKAALGNPVESLRQE